MLLRSYFWLSGVIWFTPGKIRRLGYSGVGLGYFGGTLGYSGNSSG